MKNLLKKRDEESTELIVEEIPNKKKWFVKKIVRGIKKHKVLSGVVVVAMVVTVVGYNVISARNAKMLATSQSAKISTTVLQKQDLTNSLSVTGTIASAEVKSITTQLTGVEITSVNVAVGDYVNEGDVLVTFDSSDIEESLAEAQTSLEVASAKSNMEVNSAQRNLEEAQTTQSIEAERAQGSVDSAYIDYAEAVEDRDEAYAEYEKAINKVEKKKNAYSDAKDEKADAKEKYGKDSEEYTKACDKVTSTKAAYETAQVEEEAAHEAFDKLAEVADTAYDVYEKALQNQEDTNRNNEKSVAEKQDSVTSAKLSQSTSTTSQEDQVEEYQQQLENCNVTAPFSGVITSVSVNEGDTYSGTEICVIQDSDNFIVEATVDEYDITSIAKDMTAVVKTDATGDKEFDGTVTFVAPTPDATNSIGSASSAAAYSIEIALNELNKNLRIGMTAKTSILLDSKKDVFAVPYDCIQTNEEGESVIYVLDDDTMISQMTMGDNNAKSENAETESKNMQDNENTTQRSINQKEIVVEVGLETDYYVEIASDELKEGMEVVVPEQVSSSSDKEDMMMQMGKMSGGMQGGSNVGGRSGAPGGGPGGF